MFVIDKNSWHAHLALNYPRPYRTPTNICSYIRAVIRGIFAALALSFLGALILSGFVVSAISLWFGFGLWPDGAAFVGFTIDAAIFTILLLGGISIGFSALTDKIRNSLPEKEKKQPNVLVAYLKSVKDKTCILIDYK